MATRDTDQCLQKVAPDEPIFVLRAQDALAAELVREWARRAAVHGCPAAKLCEAYDLADAMERWPQKKYPD